MRPVVVAMCAACRLTPTPTALPSSQRKRSESLDVLENTANQAAAHSKSVSTVKGFSVSCAHADRGSGEIAARICASARELDIATITISTDKDTGHTIHATETITLRSATCYTDIEELISIAKQYRVDAVHPGYGYLSESDAFAARLEDEGIAFIGPSSDILKRTGDKLQARDLAQECQVPVLPALATPTNNIDSVRHFAEQNGLPIMIKAVDGGGGRGIRLVKSIDDLASMTTRAIEESPSKQVFAERAAVDGFRHIEVQIIGDGNGNVIHLWERECSIQRRYQKVVELAPSTVDRHVVQPLIDSAVKMAKFIKYKSLGTFEFLLNPLSREYFFLEVNPRLQVEHTVTESICGIDIVRGQILLAQGLSLAEAGFTQRELPSNCSVQLRLTAEDPEKNWTLSTGKIASFRLPSGHGVRVDSALIPALDNTVNSDFDSVIAKIILTASDWEGVVRKAKRAVEDTDVIGVKTNINMLAAIVSHPDFLSGRCDTSWLESQHETLLAQSTALARARPQSSMLSHNASSAPAVSFSSSSTLFRKDDAWAISLTPQNGQAAQVHHLRVQKIMKNDFPTMLTAKIALTGPSADPVEYLMDVKTTTASASALSAQHRRGDPKDGSHVIIPFAGKLVELSVDVGDAVKQGDCIAVVQQMKMELEVRAAHDGTVTWVCDIADGEDVSEGVLAAIVDVQQSSSRSKL